MRLALCLTSTIRAVGRYDPGGYVEDTSTDELDSILDILDTILDAIMDIILDIVMSKMLSGSMFRVGTRTTWT